MVSQVVARVFVRDPGPGCRLAEAVAGLPGSAPSCVGEVGLELAALGLDVDLGPVFSGTACEWRRRRAAGLGPRRVRGGARSG